MEVPRTRFAPVKTTNDLLTLRSDAYVLTDDFRLELHPDRKGIPPVVKLDSDHYQRVDQLDSALAHGVLRHCDRLEIQGKVLLDSNLELTGNVTLKGA